MVGATRFERATLWSQTRCATKLRYAPKSAILPARAEQAAEEGVVEMPVDEVGEQIEAVFEGGRAGAPQRAQQGRRLEEAVCVDAQHVAVLPPDRLAGVVAQGHARGRQVGVRHGDAAMDLVACGRDAGPRCPGPVGLREAQRGAPNA